MSSGWVWVCDSSTKSPLGRVALTEKGQLGGMPSSDTACLAQLWSDPSDQEHGVREVC